MTWAASSKGGHASEAVSGGNSGTDSGESVVVFLPSAGVDAASEGDLTPSVGVDVAFDSPGAAVQPASSVPIPAERPDRICLREGLAMLAQFRWAWYTFSARSG